MFCILVIFYEYYEADCLCDRFPHKLHQSPLNQLILEIL